MPETRFTEVTSHHYQLIQDVRKFSNEYVQPVIDQLRHDKTRTNVNRDVAVSFAYFRLVAWMQSFEHLNHPYDVQAVTTGARALFEQHLDLVWFKVFASDPKWVDRYWAYSDVHRYQTAQKVLKHKQDHPASSIDPKVYQDWINHCDKTEPMEQKVQKLWGTDKKGKTIWPKHHWTGIGDLRVRAEKLGPEYEDEYVKFYAILSALVHPGPTMLGYDLERLEISVAFAYFHAFRHSYNSMLLLCELLTIEHLIPQLDAFKHTILKYINDAASTYPKEA